MAGGTGGHIFPGLAVADALSARGWRVHWLGAPDSMEAQLVPPRGYAFETVTFGGVRGKGLKTLLALPVRLLRAMTQSAAVIRRVQPAVLVGLGGYITFPAGLMGRLVGRPLVLHEQNAVAGLANKLLARFAERTFTAFPRALLGAECVGNPLRVEFTQMPAPEQRFANRTGLLKLLVVGGSLGAKALNEVVPQALALLAPEYRPNVAHQSGAKQIDALREAYAAVDVEAATLPFIDDMANAYAEADVVICRAGASTVSEIAAIGAAALFVPFPYAVDDHQTRNARYLSDNDAAWLIPQAELTPQRLADWLGKLTRAELVRRASKAQTLEKRDAAEHIAAACEQLVSKKGRQQ
jgi:UDP-N-acetylglucosamine--N-acetylmuramyl-(pentapeptide) pyrophosphoryl-undecaprenol N-acetylglucosamine transferase